MEKLKLIMAVSRDGFVARGPIDDMRWTGRTDKKVFQLLTLASPTVLLGRRTFEQMPQLPGRRVLCLSTDPRLGQSLEAAAAQHPGAWLGGGPAVAQKALELGLVDQAFVCENAAQLVRGIRFDPIRRLLPRVPARTVVIDDDLTVLHYDWRKP